eukprot:CFRG3391T1
MKNMAEETDVLLKAAGLAAVVKSWHSGGVDGDSSSDEDSSGPKTWCMREKILLNIGDDFNINKMSRTVGEETRLTLLITRCEHGREVIKVHKAWIAPIAEHYYIDISSGVDDGLALCVVVPLEEGNICNRFQLSTDEAKNWVKKTEAAQCLLMSKEGQHRLHRVSNGEGKDHIQRMKQHYCRQQHCCGCGIAALSIANNVLAPNPKELTSQDKVLEIAANVIDMQKFQTNGVTLQQLYDIACRLFLGRKSYVVKIERPQTKEALTEMLDVCLNKPTSTLICNYDMGKAGQGNYWYGHFSPIGAFDKQTQSVLVMDVWMFTDPFWVPVADLLQATIDKDLISDEARGFITVTCGG